MITYKNFQITGNSGAYGWESPEGVTCGPVFAHMNEAESSIDQYIAAMESPPVMGAATAEPICAGCGYEPTHCDCEREPEEFKGPWSVAVFRIDRAYGGPEEGGWWYGCGEPVIAPNWPLPVFYTTLEAARAGREAMDSEIEKLGLNDGLPSIDSVLSQGRYAAQISDGMPAAFPKVRPHYE